ncbi:hypothetical protein ACFU8R_16890 [Pseudonocardia alni]|uniref:hypothetical protein n=1 Tax=Pseudonocardia alni TaxID=33907 RepID=UPI003693BD89
MHVVNGERKPIKPAYTNREDAEFAAKTQDKASDRWTGAAEPASPQERRENQKTQEP